MESKAKYESQKTTPKMNASTTVSNQDISVIDILVGNSLSVIATGIAARIYFPCGVTLYSWSLLSDASGSIVFDLWVDVHGNAPPTVADTITASAKPTLSSAQKGQSSALTNWKTFIQPDSWMIVNVDSCTTIKACTLGLTIRKGK